MRRLESQIDRSDATTDADFRRNEEASLARLQTLREALERVRAGGSEGAVERHRSRGKLFVRDRVDALLDPGSPFLELGALAGWDLYGPGRSPGGDVPSGGIVTGVGRVADRLVMVV
ncbi:MAG: carboxyl transferase domain-containing protein, partial [Planctomycetota bacterium]